MKAVQLACDPRRRMEEFDGKVVCETCHSGSCLDAAQRVRVVWAWDHHVQLLGYAE